MARVLLISVGNELLSGQTLNTNANFLAKELTQLGFTVNKMITLPDEQEIVSYEIRNALSSKEYRLIMITGGLGPTWDDSTSKFLADALDVPWELNPDALAIVKTRYEELQKEGLVENAKINPARKKMAFLPLGTAAIHNPVGTAPGIFFKDSSLNVNLYCFPGVPKEMKAMFKALIPKLELMQKNESIFHFETEITTPFKDESLLAPFLSKVREKYDVWIKSLPKSYQEEELIHLIISAYDSSIDRVERTVQEAQIYLEDLFFRNNKRIIKE